MSRRSSAFVLGHEPRLELPLFVLLSVYISYGLIVVIGHIRDFFGLLCPLNYSYIGSKDGYAAFSSGYESFLLRRFYRRMDDCFARPVSGSPGRQVLLIKRTPEHSGGIDIDVRALNVASQNYLGFAEPRGGCTEAVEAAIRYYGISCAAPRLTGGTLHLHRQAEALVAKFLGTEDALISSMGFATNTTTIPALVSNDCLILSDTLNHTSIRLGSRLSGATICSFRHNDLNDLEGKLRTSFGQRKLSSWRKIVVVVEGLYSMEGTIVDLPGLIALKKRYKFYLFIDEAHSMGTLGPHGRGITDYYSITPAAVDLLMGTFSKSFGASGGYVAGSHELIESLRLRSHAGLFAESISPPVLAHIIMSIAHIMGVEPSDSLDSVAYYLQRAPRHLIPKWMDLAPTVEDGSNGAARLRRLAFNARYLSRGLTRLGFVIYSHTDSPIVPLLMFSIGKMAPFSRMMLARSVPIAVVVVTYPATSLTTSRARFCVSASHTKEDIDELLRACDEIGDILDLKLNKRGAWTIDAVTSHAADLVHE